VKDNKSSRRKIKQSLQIYKLLTAEELEDELVVTEITPIELENKTQKIQKRKPYLNDE